MGEHIVQACQLTKNFKTLTAVDHIDFSIRQGECFGFLGPNGAGKTTTVRMIYCFTPLSSGSLTVFGMDVNRHARAIKSLVGICPQETNLDPDFSVEKNLWVFGRYFGFKKSHLKDKIESLLSFTELTGKRKEKVEYLSGGMKRRLLLARSLVNNPRLLILDEPTTGLDPQARHLIWERIQELKRQGVTIVLTTHYMDEAKNLCDRLLFIDHGKIVELGEPDHLIHQHAGREVLEMFNLTEDQKTYLMKQQDTLEFFGSRAFHYGHDVHHYIDHLRSENASFTNYLIRPANLEDVFLKLTGRALRE